MNNLSPTQVIVLAILAPPAAAIYLCLLWSVRERLTDDVEQPHGWEERRE